MIDFNATSVATRLPAGGVAITATKVSGIGIAIRGSKNTDTGWAEIRARRDTLLAACDWTQMPDVPLSEASKAAWIDYRQALRDVTSVAHIADVAWPVAPSAKA